MWQGKEMGADRPYESPDYVMRIVAVASGGIVKTVSKVVRTVTDIEKKRKTLRRLQKQLTSQSILQVLMRLLNM
ncbi:MULTISPECIES: hypothetical protein [Bacillus cereus group]|uniref:Uncharacterized protein n=1 Tax=Bacillus cereus TaxID=1396 RepID=A0A0G8EYT3_BACCE|nr:MULTISPECIES: hypothetical protein [Bacillus cereus group]KLA29483.1 hypothetical protein B4077_3543 [Bacillus cereus]MCQ6544521.1 hypothetical protein [Bacillus wiedmannii]MCQ6574272.1 hypothetical protein [Bacillus wiedmannii]SCC35566.1 Protein of unknown function [Bacillus cereus]